MHIGELNTLVVIERQEEDLGLGIVRRWLPTGKKAWASVEMLSGQELVAAQQIEARANCRLETHWQPDIKPADRLVTEHSQPARVFNIVAADNVMNQNRELRLVCIEVLK